MIWDGMKKVQARQIALDYTSDERAAGVFVPAGECRCTRMALKTGAITRHKPLYCIERNPKTFAAMKKTAQALFTQTYLFNDELHRLRLNHPVDLAYIDLMGSMNQDIFDWLKHVLIPRLTRNFRVSLLFSLSRRPGSPFLASKDKEYKNGKHFQVSFAKDCGNDTRIVTYLAIMRELFDTGVFVHTQGRPYYCYNDNKASVVLYTITPLTKGTNVTNTLPSNHLETLVNHFAGADKSGHKLRGFKRCLTLYCKNRQEATGTPAWRFKAHVKATLTKRGFDTSCLS